MRLGQAIFFGTAAALLTLAAPTLARNSSANSHTAKATEAPASGLVGAVALPGNGLQGDAPIPLRHKERDRTNTVNAFPSSITGVRRVGKGA